MSGSAASDVWAVGYAHLGEWSGNLIIDRHPGDMLSDVAAGTTWAVAVGTRLGATSIHPLHLMWDGTRWRRT